MIDSPEKIAEARQLMDSLSDSERRRLAQFFADVLAASDPPPVIEWSDNAPDGSRKAPEASASATNGSL